MGQDHKWASVITAPISGLSDQCMCVWATYPQVFHWPDANEKVLVLHSNLYRHSTSTWLPQKEASWEATLNVMSYFLCALCALPIVDSQIEQTWPDFHLLVLHHPSTCPQPPAQTNTTERHTDEAKMWLSHPLHLWIMKWSSYLPDMPGFWYIWGPPSTLISPISKFGYTHPYVLHSII